MQNEGLDLKSLVKEGAEDEPSKWISWGQALLKQRELREWTWWILGIETRPKWLLLSEHQRFETVRPEDIGHSRGLILSMIRSCWSTSVNIFWKISGSVMDYELQWGDSGLDRVGVLGWRGVNRCGLDFGSRASEFGLDVSKTEKNWDNLGVLPAHLGRLFWVVSGGLGKSR